MKRKVSPTGIIQPISPEGYVPIHEWKKSHRLGLDYYYWNEEKQNILDYKVDGDRPYQGYWTEKLKRHFPSGLRHSYIQYCTSNHFKIPYRHSFTHDTRSYIGYSIYNFRKGYPTKELKDPIKLGYAFKGARVREKAKTNKWLEENDLAISRPKGTNNGALLHSLYKFW